jgi:hypothetical protein
VILRLHTEPPDAGEDPVDPGRIVVVGGAVDVMKVGLPSDPTAPRHADAVSG